MKVSPDSVAALVARSLKNRGVKRVFALCGGHIMPMWMQVDAAGVEIVAVRDERPADPCGTGRRSAPCGRRRRCGRRG